MNKSTENAASASLRVLTNRNSIQFISEALGAVATRQYLKGQPQNRHDPESKPRENSLWIYESPLPETSDLSEHVSRILGLLESRNDALNQIRNEIVTMDICCMFSSENGQGSTGFSSQLLNRLAAQKIDLVIDLYPPSTSD